MHPFDDLGEVQSTLQRLMNRQPALVKVLAKQPGTKESRYVHLLSGDVEPEVVAGDHRARTGHANNPDRMGHLESEIAELRNDVADLKQQFAAFRKQFE